MGQEHFVNDSEVAAESAVNGADGKASVPMDCTENEFASGPKVNSESMKVSRPWEIGGDNNGPSFYRQDIVRLNKDETLVGIVTEVGGDSDSDVIDDDDDDNDDDDDDESDDDEEEDEENETAHDDNEDENGDMRKSHDEKYDLTSDQVRVMWLDHSEKTHNCNEVTVIDRAFLHGDIVVAASDRTGQMGIVLNVNIWVDLLAADGSLIKDVSSRELKRVREFVVGDYVVLGSWLGRVDEVLDHVTVMFDDGSMCKVTKADPMRLKPVSKSVLEDEHFPFYPGQRVKASSSSVFKNARWLSGLWKASRLEGTVTKVNVASVIIYWIASASSGSESATAPAEEQTPKNLKLLSCLAYANWQVGDWCFLPPVAESSALSSDKKSSRLKSEDPTEGGSICSELESEHGLEGIRLDKLDDGFSSVPNTDAMDLYIVLNQDVHTCENSLPVIKEPLHENRILHHKKMRKVVVRKDKKGRKKVDNFERALLIANTKTRVDVIWQDGKREYGVFSTSLVPIEDPGDQELVPEQYVVEKASDDNDNTGEVRRVGVVRSVNAKERTACVRWLKPVDRPEDPREFDKEEMVSLYGLEEHPDYDYCYGDVVIRLSPVSDSGNLVEETEQDIPTEDKLDPESNSCNETAEDTNETVEDTNETAEDTSNDETYADFSDLSWVGNITGLKDGDIEVTWADGMVSTVGPQAIYVVGRDDDESIEVGSEIGDDDARSWQTLNEDDMDTLDTVEEEAGVQNANSVGSEAETTVNSDDNSSGRSGPLSILGFMTRLASGIFSRGRKQSDPSKESQSLGTVDASDRSTSEVESSSQDSDAIDNSGRSGPLSILGFMTRLASGIFSLGRKQSDPSKESQSSGTVDASDRSASEVESSSQDSDAIDNFAEEDGHASEAADASMAVEILYSLRSDEPDVGNMMHPCSFRHFDTAKDPLDHFFLGANGQTNSGKRWLKKVQEDWDILQNNLPDSIYVRVYEDRMDLLRAVIVGAYGTPYQDGLFFFDFHLPSDYPLVPPSAHYHSGGWRINPNLYEEGKVCLSLLNTWTGRGNEVWDPSSSSILQVLVSLQGLVLNSKPYFNEAGYDKQAGTAEGEKNSLDYNENTFLLSCKYMMYLLRKPPKDFEELIKEHFQRRGHYILTACDAYMNGFAIGSLREDASLSDTSKESSPSVGFKLMLAKIVPKLFAALDEVGADVHQFKHLQQL